jgi:hypothetical protein
MPSLTAIRWIEIIILADFIASCGEELYGDDVYEGDIYPGIMWHCDRCGALLNKQDGFKDSCGSWTCAECQHSNPISEDAIVMNNDFSEQKTQEACGNAEKA